MTYPDGIDALVNVNAGDSLAAGGHAARHNSVNTALVEVKDYLVGALGSKLDVAGGKILQIVRATDSTFRITTSTSFVDVTGMSVTITPHKNDSAILVLAAFCAQTFRDAAGDEIRGRYRLTDSSDNVISGGEQITHGTNNLTGSGRRSIDGSVMLLGRDTPATIMATTYKLRFRSPDGNVNVCLLNGDYTGQMYAIEVSA
jgi:hypothetical protein